MHTSKKTRCNAAAVIMAAVAVFISFTMPARAELDIIPVSEVTEGMSGYGLTVFHGSEITKFPLVVRGVMPGSGMTGEPLILVELTGDEVEAFGGISQGMSGSPIYLNGKLAGALAITFPFTDHSLGGVTPIEAMIRAAEYDDVPEKPEFRGEIDLEKPLRLGDRTYRRMRRGGGPAADDDVLVARAAVAPVAVRGFSPRTYKYIERLFNESGVEIKPITGPLGKGMKMPQQDIAPGEDIVPGSSVAVQLVTGDMDMSGVGTVTAVDGDTVFMFGHPFFRKGPVNFLLSDAPVLAIVQGDDMPFKVTNTGALRGCVTQDRGSALVGHLDTFPQLIPLEIKGVDRDLNRENTTRVKIVDDRDILPNLVLMVILDTLDNTIDKIGGGTSNIKFTLKVDGFDEDITRENMFFDRYDIAAKTLAELVDLLLMLNENRFYDSDITGMKVEVEMDSSRSVAVIEKAWLAGSEESALTPDFTVRAEPVKKESAKAGESDPAPEADEADATAEEEESTAGEALAADYAEEFSEIGDSGEDLPIVHPGDKVEVAVRVRPFRDEPVEESIFLKVPHDIPYGKAVINVFSGTRDMPVMSPGGFVIEVKVEGPEERDQGDGSVDGEVDAQESFDDMLRDFMERDLNNELVATIESTTFKAHDIDEEDDDSDADEEDEPEMKSKKKTGWVLNGKATLKVKVVDPTGSDDSFKTRSIRKSSINALKNK